LNLVLVVDGNQPDLTVRREVVVDHAEPAALSLAAASVPPPHLPESAGPWDHLSRLGILRKLALELPIVVVAEVVGDELREQRRFDELHPLSIRKVRIDVQLGG